MHASTSLRTAVLAAIAGLLLMLAVFAGAQPADPHPNFHPVGFTTELDDRGHPCPAGTYSTGVSCVMEEQHSSESAWLVALLVALGLAAGAR